MKSLKFFLLLLFAMLSCSRKDKEEPIIEPVDNIILFDKITEAGYGGYFSFQNTNYWCSLKLTFGRYEEWPSGGAAYQKSMRCLEVGNYSLKNHILTFELDSLKFPWYPVDCIPDMQLSGTYELIYNDYDSLVFRRGSENSEIVYHLRHYLSDTVK